MQPPQGSLSVSRDSQPARVFDTPRPSSSLRNTTTSSAAGIAIAAAAASGGRSNHHNCDTASVQSQSLGSSVDPDDEIKAIMARAVHGLKAQEAVRFKQHMSRMEARVKQLAESHVASLQNVLQQYQVHLFLMPWNMIHMQQQACSKAPSRLVSSMLPCFQEN